MMSKKEEPKFVNLQYGAIHITNERGQAKVVKAWERRTSDTDEEAIVVGEHYKQFVSAKGPLYPFPLQVEAVSEVVSTPSEKKPTVENKNASKDTAVEATKSKLDIPNIPEDEPVEIAEVEEVKPKAKAKVSKKKRLGRKSK